MPLFNMGAGGSGSVNGLPVNHVKKGPLQDIVAEDIEDGFIYPGILLAYSESDIRGNIIEKPNYTSPNCVLLSYDLANNTGTVCLGGTARCPGVKKGTLCATEADTKSAIVTPEDTEQEESNTITRGFVVYAFKDDWVRAIPAYKKPAVWPPEGAKFPWELEVE